MMASKPTYEELEKRIRDLKKEITEREDVQGDIEKNRLMLSEAEKIIQSEAQKAAILNGITTNLAFVNEKLEILWANKASADSVGKTLSEVIGRKCHELWADPQTPCEDCPTIKAFKTRRTEHLIIKTPDGRVWDEKGEPVFDANGVLLGVLEIAHDITAQIRAEEALRKSEQKFKELFDSITDLIYVQDLEGRFISFNPAMEKLLGYEKNELIGRKASDVMNPKWRALFESEYLETIKKRGFQEGTSVYYRKDGRKLYLEYRSKLVKPEEGEPFITGMGRDVTSRIEAEREKKRLQEQLLHTRKMEAVATLSGGIAHDYNNLLSIIMGNLSLAKDETKPGSELAGFLEEITNASYKLRDLTHELMALARGGTPVKRVASLKDLLQGVSGAVSSESGISIKESISKDLWPAPHDAHKMGVVFRNVLNNAVEAMPAGGIITIKAENLRAEDDGAPMALGPLKGLDCVHISIADQGKGIPPENLGKIFDPYFSTKRMGVQKGMGLGLATSYAIVQKHGGHIAIDSSPGAGTQVHIYLPAERRSAKMDRDTPSKDDAPLKRVLLMDDEAMLRKLAEQMLKKLGYGVETVRDGAEAIKTYKKQQDLGEPFDVVILDLTIKGGMGGEQTLGELLKIDPRINAIVSSGYFDAPIMSDFRKQGFVGAIAKPYEKKTLKEALERVLK
jgi:two-component system cell cycle sensor histidine kinase/response regulator CckA